MLSLECRIYFAIEFICDAFLMIELYFDDVLTLAESRTHTAQ